MLSAQPDREIGSKIDLNGNCPQLVFNSDVGKEEYLDLYTYYLLDNYSPILMKYSDEKYNIIKISKSGNKDYDADINVIRKDGPPLKLRYHIKEDLPGQYKAVDMLVEGVSTILNQRSEFSHIIQEKGLSNLLNNLRERKNRNN